MTNSMRACLFGGAIFAAGVAEAQEFEWAYSPLGGPSTVVLLQSDDGVEYEYLYDDNVAPAPITGSLASGPYLTSAACTATVIEGAGQTGPGLLSGFVGTFTAAYATVMAPTTVEVTWDLENSDQRPAYAGGTAFISSVDPVTGIPIDTLYSLHTNPLAGALSVELEPGVLYVFNIDFFTYGNDGAAGTGFVRYAIVSDCFADCDDSGTVNIDDIDCFVAGFLAGDTSISDCDGNGICNLDDIDCFVSAFLGGCP